MRGSLIAVIVLLLAAAAFCAGRASAQTAKRFQVHEHQPHIFGGATGIAAVCDTGNGTMVYIVYIFDSISSSSVPNGCRKNEAER